MGTIIIMSTDTTTTRDGNAVEGKPSSVEQSREVAHLRLLHLADSALPIGSLAHSFGLESLTANEQLSPPELEGFFEAYLEEAGVMEGVFCREGFRLAGEANFSSERWVEINERLSALKPARESRAASAALGQHFMAAVLNVGEFAVVGAACAASIRARSVVHHSPAFGLVGGALALDEEEVVVLAYLHQSTAALISACQRLLPLGQSEATRILWNLKPAIVETARRGRGCALEDACCFTPLLEWGAMEHPALTTRLFIS